MLYYYVIGALFILAIYSMPEYKPTAGQLIVRLVSSFIVVSIFPLFIVWFAYQQTKKKAS